MNCDDTWCQMFVSGFSQEDLKSLKSHDCDSCIINNKECRAILELAKRVGVGEIYKVYKDNCDEKHFKKYFIERLGK